MYSLQVYTPFSSDRQSGSLEFRQPYLKAPTLNGYDIIVLWAL